MGLIRKSKDGIVDFYEYREYSYYSKYKYRASIEHDGIKFMRFAENIDSWERTINATKLFYRSYRSIDRDDPVDREKSDREARAELLKNKPIINDIYGLISKHDQAKKDKKMLIRLEGNKFSFFFNDIKLLSEIKAINPLLKTVCTEVKLEEFAGVKYFVNEPKHKYRVYLKSKRVESSVVVEFRNFFDSRPDVKPSYAMSRWISPKLNDWRQRYSSSNYYIDYSTESDLSYLALCYGELLGKKYKLEKRKSSV